MALGYLHECSLRCCGILVVANSLDFLSNCSAVPELHLGTVREQFQCTKRYTEQTTGKYLNMLLKYCLQCDRCP